MLDAFAKMVCGYFSTYCELCFSTKFVLQHCMITTECQAWEKMWSVEHIKH